MPDLVTPLKNGLLARVTLGVDVTANHDSVVYMLLPLHLMVVLQTTIALGVTRFPPALPVQCRPHKSRERMFNNPGFEADFLSVHGNELP
jgi:hypothetical protein